MGRAIDPVTVMAYNDTALLIVNELNPDKRARFNAAPITSGQQRVYDLPDQNLALIGGPASATDGHLAVFDGTTGKLLKDGGAPAAGSGNTGTATLDFGAFPGASDTSIAVTGQTGIVAGSIVQAWLRPVDTADHLADEHLVETLRIEVGNIVAGTGFTIYGAYHGAVALEPTTRSHDGVLWYFNTATALLSRSVPPGVVRDVGGKVIRAYGKWAVNWRWS